MRNRTNKFTISDFYCTRCGNQGLSIPRRPNKQREPGHLKRLWCPYCQMETNHAEIRAFGSNYTIEDFKLEYELGRFVEGEKKEIKDLLSCSKKDCKYWVEGKCWNSNYSFDCGHRVVKHNA